MIYLKKNCDICVGFIQLTEKAQQIVYRKGYSISRK